MDSHIAIIPFSPAHIHQVREICYRTGYKGKDLSNLDIFTDKVLFVQIFCEYYIRYEPENCFVAVDREINSRVVGYIIGTQDSEKQIKQYTRRIVPEIVKRMLSVTILRYPRSFVRVMRAIPALIHGHDAPIATYFPAHFHINLHPEYQGQGIGKQLIFQFENHLRQHAISAVHLTTSTGNQAAIGFYRYLGYTILLSSPTTFWQDTDEKTVVMGKLIR